MFIFYLYFNVCSSSDIRTPPLPWNSSVASKGTGKKRLRIAYMKTDGWFDPVPAVQRAVDISVEALKSLVSIV